MKYLLTIFLASVVCYGQTASTGSAKTTGVCSPAVTGSRNVVTISCPIDKKEGERMLAILNKILTNQIDTTEVMDKLDQILRARAQSIQTVNAPNGIAAIGGTLINPTVNNFAPPKRILSPELAESLSKCLATRPGVLQVSAFASEPEAYSYAGQWRDIFKNAGWTIKENRIGTFMIGGGIWTGTHVQIKGTFDSEGKNPIIDLASPGGTFRTCTDGKSFPDPTSIELNNKDVSADLVILQVGPHPM